MEEDGLTIAGLAGVLGLDAAVLEAVMPWLALALLVLAFVIRLRALLGRGRTIVTALLDFGRGTWTAFEGSVVAILLVAGLLLLGLGLAARVAEEAPRAPPAAEAARAVQQSAAGNRP
jgi:hypothetical protein